MKVVLLPGLDGTGVLFKPFIEALPDEIDTLVISYPSNTRLSYQELTELVISQLPEEDFILVAESFSGYIAYQVAFSKPKNLKLVIFVAAFLENPHPFLIALSHWLPTNYILSASMPDFIVKTFLFDLVTNKKIIALFKQSMKQVAPQVLSYRLQEIAKLSNGCQSCEVKAIYMQATDDKLVPEKCVLRFKKLFNDISVFKIKSSHFILQTNPLACVELIVKGMRNI